MAAATKFNCFMTDVAAGLHANALNADTDTLKAYLSNTAPNVATMTRKADLAEIAAGNGYVAGGPDIQNAATKAGAVITVTATDATITAAGGSIGPFQYVIIYNATAAGGPLIQYYDRGSALTLADGDSVLLDFGVNLLQIGG